MFLFLMFNEILLNLAAKKERASNGYLLIATSGGLNQQRTGVSLDCFYVQQKIFLKYYPTKKIRLSYLQFLYLTQVITCFDIA